MDKDAEFYQAPKPVKRIVKNNIKSTLKTGGVKE